MSDKTTEKKPGEREQEIIDLADDIYEIEGFYEMLEWWERARKKLNSLEPNETGGEWAKWLARACKAAEDWQYDGPSLGELTILQAAPTPVRTDPAVESTKE